MLCRLHPRGALRRALLRSTSRPRPLAAVAPVSAPPAAPALAPPSAVEPVTSAYVHLPFCRRRCFYCSFDIQVLGDRGGDSRLRAVTSYVDAVVADVAACPLPCGPLRTVFFGGGTPSLVPPAQLARVLAALRARCGLAPDAEVSLECDPGTFSRASLEAYLALGVTRINVGVQSFDQDALAVAGRAHSAEDVANALADVKAANPPSWGLDLISGLPHVSAAQWDATLAAAVAVAPHHVSVYDLQVEPRTLFGRRYVPGKFPLPGEGAAADMYRAAVRALTAAGYRQYEVSNFALPGHECAHNLAYWRAGADGALRGWRAFGCAAASHTPAAGGSGGATPGRRFTRPRTVAEYSAWVARGCDEREGGGGEGEASEPLAEALMMGLRLVEGVPLGPLRDAHGAAAAAAVAGALGGRHAAAGLAAVEEEAGGADGRGVARLTSPEGFLLSNSLISDVLAEVDRARRREARSAATAAAAATAEAGARARAQAQAGGA